jgi:transcriptional regulator with XRE-family HTH domain
MSDTRPDWAQRMRAEREGRGWTQMDAVRAMASHGGVAPRDSLLRQWRRWESGKPRPGRHHQRLIARTFGVAVDVFFPPQPKRPNLRAVDTADLIERLRKGGLNAATMADLEATTERLCCEYSHQPSDELHADGKAWLRRITGTLDRRLTLAQHRDILALSGKVALLVGCVEYDMGRRGPAEKTRRSALSLGEESGDVDTIGWAHEMAAWYALTQGDYRSAVAATETGLAAVGPTHSVAVQLNAHRAKAWARMRDRREVEVALDAGRAVLDGLPYPSNVANHFVVDPSKWDFFTMDCYRHVGEDELAKVYAEEVMRAGTAPDGTVVKPMRVAEAEITLGVVAARRGDLDGAVQSGRRALSLGRKSLPSLLLHSRELVDVLRNRFGQDPVVDAYADELRALAA